MYFVPGGQHDSSQVFLVQAEIRSIVPLGRGYFPHNPRHFVPGYYQPVPPGQKPFGPRAPRLKLTRMGACPSAPTGGICFHAQPHLVIPLCGSFVILRKRETSGLPPNNRAVVVSIFAEIFYELLKSRPMNRRWSKFWRQ